MHAFRVLAIGIAFALSFVLSSSVQAQTDYPNRPVKILVGYGAGGTGDVSVRIVAEKLSGSLGQPFVIENRPGAGGIIASQAALNAPRDGYTLILGATGNFAMAPSLIKSMTFDVTKDFDMVSLMGTFGYAMLVRADSKLQTAQDFIAAAKANPGKLSIGTIASGSGQYLTAELLKSMAGIDALTVPYKDSGAVIAALRSGDVDASFETIAPVMGQIQAGTLRAIGITETQRFSGLPDVPTIAESGVPGFDVSVWNAIATPAGAPKATIDRLNREIAAALAMPDVRERFLALGITARASTQEEITALLRKDIASWRSIIQKSNLVVQ